MNIRHVWETWSVFLPIWGVFQVSTCPYCLKRVEGPLSPEDAYEVCPTLYRWSLPHPAGPPAENLPRAR
jgi:hypothetical protein